MRHIELRRRIRAEVEKQLPPHHLPHKYALNYAESERVSQISLVINHQPNENYLSPGTYHFNHVSCTCPREKKGLLHRIHSVFRRKSSERSWVPTPPCNVHSLNYDVLLESNKPFANVKEVFSSM